MKKTVFIGCVESSYIILKHMLQKGYIVSGVVTMDDSPINSDFHSLVPLAKEYGIDVICTKNINDEETLEFIKNKKPDVIYCFGWSRLIGKELLALPPYGVIGFHPAAIPMNRGRHPLIWALVLGLDKTASTFFVMDEGADTGDIISQKDVIIGYDDDAQTLYDKVLNTAKNQVIEFTDKISMDSLVRLPQDKNVGNTWRKRGRLDGQIDFRMSCEGIYNLVRALTHPYVGAHFMMADVEVKVWKCNVYKCDDYKNLEPGKILKVYSETEFEVKAYDGIVHVLDCDNIILKEGEYLR
ncbi:formyltransferase family protein [Butyrivibrio sp. MB2005]|uniref:formyltransferase family protein n=1 Tax=Butyrivibrio sp. MB2005 TaxID=1280678 RepID=UPI000402D1C3|nr:formyltransferase family protein [Butyrivibrio sp. MB2005]